MTTITPDVTIAFSAITLTGELYHNPDRDILELITDEGIERLSTDLGGYGLESADGAVFIKDWSEHRGLTEELERQGYIKVLRKVFVGPFSSRAYEVLVTA